MRLLILSVLCAVFLVSRASAELRVADPRCEGLRDAPQVDTATPRFSWQLATDERAVRQSACQLRCVEIDGVGRAVGPEFDSGRVTTEQSQWVEFPGLKLKPRASYAWQVRVWDQHGRASEWSESRRFGTGLLGARWPADWIGDGRAVEISRTAPARYLRGTFTLERAPVRARLYVSAFGLVDPWINGRPVTEDRFVPGWPDYRQRFFYAAYDVTSLLQTGANALGLILGDGWYSGTLLPQHQFGSQPTASAFLDVTDADGKTTTFSTGRDWRWAEGPITLNSIYHGEKFDARRERPDWSTAAGGADWEWRPVSVRGHWDRPQSATARTSPPVRRIETRQPIAMRSVRPGVWQYDLGQNMVGWVRLRVQAPAGTEVTLRFAEMLEADGRLHTANLRDAQATARYIARGDGVEEWEPRFTFFGFRYVELSGVDQPRPDAVEGVVVHTALPRTGEFTCSDESLNQLFQNTLWGQKGNFLELPTDCPQRNERLGWTGDAQVFAPTALYNMDAGRFYQQWLAAVRDSLRDGPDGGFGDTAPETGFGRGSAGWGEAAVIIPWTVYVHTGDPRVLREALPSIQHGIELMANQAPDGIRRSPGAWGDWLAPGFPMFKAPPSYEVIATAYLAHSADLAARIAEVVDRPELAARNRALRDKVRAAFQREFVAADGRVSGDAQTSYLLALGFDLVPDAQREQLVAHLVRKIAEAENHLSTGFLGTPLLTPVLTRVGRADLAYTVLQQKTFPGWLMSVKNGATTIWERWDSWTPENGFNKDGMNSFNHYAYGSVVGWFYDTIAGLRPLAEAPGWKRFTIAPEPGGGLTSAAAKVVTPYGLAESSWRIEAGRFRLRVRIPANTEATIRLPSDEIASATCDAPGAGAHFMLREGRIEIALPSGSYELSVPAR